MWITPWKKGFSFLLLGIIVYFLSSFFIAAQNHGIADNEAEVYIKLLWSESDQQRKEAKGKLLELGEKAIPWIIALLQDLTDRPGFRYVPGKGPDPIVAKEHKHNLFIDEKRDESLKQLKKFEISSRLRNDILDLLGELRAKDAVPLLVKIMEREDQNSMIIGMTPVMRTITKIGAEAVPDLVESLEYARLTAATFPFANARDLTEEQKQRILELETNKIQTRNVLVLESIADNRALPALENMLVTTNDEFLAVYLKRAIETIKAKNNVN